MAVNPFFFPTPTTPTPFPCLSLALSYHLPLSWFFFLLYLVVAFLSSTLFSPLLCIQMKITSTLTRFNAVPAYFLFFLLSFVLPTLHPTFKLHSLLSFLFSLFLLSLLYYLYIILLLLFNFLISFIVVHHGQERIHFCEPLLFSEKFSVRKLSFL